MAIIFKKCVVNVFETLTHSVECQEGKNRADLYSILSNNFIGFTDILQQI